MCKRERAEQPSPYRPLMIGGVALLRRARVPPMVAGLARPEAAEAEGDEEFACAHVDDGLLLRRRKSGLRQRDGKDLIRAQRRIVVPSPPWAVDHIETKLGCGIPKTREAGL